MARDSLDTSLAKTIREVWAADVLADASRERRARHLLLDTLGCAIAGLATPEARDLAETLARSEPGVLIFPGLRPGLSPGAFLMAFSAAACAFEGPEGLGLRSRAAWAACHSSGASTCYRQSRYAAADPFKRDLGI